MDHSFDYKELFTPEAIDHLDRAFDGMEPFFLDDIILESRAADLLVVYEKYFRHHQSGHDLNIQLDAMNAVLNDGVYWKQMLPKTEKLSAFRDFFQYLCSFYQDGSEEKKKSDTILAVLTKALAGSRDGV